MREVRRYSLVDVDREASRARVARDGRPLGFIAEGVLLEAQFELGDGSSLLWVTEDCPYEEGLHVYLVGPDGARVDALEAGAPYAPGLLTLHATGEDWAELSFFQNELRYRLEVAREARFRRPLPTGWRYTRWLARHRLGVTVASSGET